MLKELEYFLSGKINEECGVFGIFANEKPANLIYYGLHALQHRGQEGVGIATSDNKEIYRIRGEGLVSEIFNSENLETLKGTMGIGHVRYSTFGGGGIDNVQPLYIRSHMWNFAIVHNGNIVNATELKRELESQGSVFQSTSDSEIIGHLIQRESGSLEERIIKSLPKLEGAFAFLIMDKDTIYAIRDKNGLRPLALGRLNDGYVVSSESSAFEIIGGKYFRDAKPGEVIKISQDGVSSRKYTEKTQDKMCAMEYIYFSRPDSNIGNLNVHASRRICGRNLGKESDVEADIVIGVPDSSISAAIGYSEETGIDYELGLIKSRYVGRTFIKPTQELREKGVKMKLSVIESIVKGKRVVLVDDSIVRGTTSKQIIKLLRDAGATAIHMRIASPPIISPCFYGVDTSTYNELISNRLKEDELCQYIGADSLKFLSLDGLKNSLGEKICLGCFTEEYPTPVFDLIKKLKKEKNND